MASPSSTTADDQSSSPAANTAPPSLSAVFADLNVRFFLNLPDDELSSWSRTFYQLQLAHWFYCDFYSDRFPSLPRYNLKVFAQQFFRYCPVLVDQLSHFNDVYEAFTEYLSSIPVCGVILLSADMQRVVMVKSYHGQSWGFPRGKLDENENEVQCAMRECAEEVGLQLEPAQVSETDCIEATVNKKSVKMFIVHPVDDNTHFETKTRKEISAIEWIAIKNINDKKFYYNALSFVPALKRWIQKRQKGGKNSHAPSQSQSHAQSKPISISQKKGKKAHTASLPASLPTNTLSFVPLALTSSSSSPHHQHSSTNTRPSSASNTRRGNHSRSAHGSSAIDSYNSDTFQSSSATGWSPEEMFALNEKRFGIKSSVPEEKLDIPDNIDEIVANILGKNHKKKTGKKNHGNGQPPRPASRGSGPSQRSATLTTPISHSATQHAHYHHNPHSLSISTAVINNASAVNYNTTRSATPQAPLHAHSLVTHTVSHAQPHSASAKAHTAAGDSEPITVTDYNLKSSTIDVNEFKFDIEAILQPLSMH